MARATDADALYNLVKRRYQVSSGIEHRCERDLLDLICNMPTLTPPNDPLTMEELREMDGPVWATCKPIESGNGYWCLCQHGHIITPAGSIYDVKEIPHWVFYRRPLEEEV